MFNIVKILTVHSTFLSVSKLYQILFKAKLGQIKIVLEQNENTQNAESSSSRRKSPNIDISEIYSRLYLSNAKPWQNQIVLGPSGK